MHALVVTMVEEIAGLEDGRVYLFESDEIATRFAVDKLTEAGELIFEDGQWRDSEDRFSTDSATEALDQFQMEWLASSECLHVYEVVDKRTCEAPVDEIERLRERARRCLCMQCSRCGGYVMALPDGARECDCNEHPEQVMPDPNKH